MTDQINRVQEVRTAKKNQISKHLLPILILSLVVGLYWIKLADPVKPQNPEYNFAEVEAISKVNLITMWSWLDYKSYKRYSPTGLLLFGEFPASLPQPETQRDPAVIRMKRRTAVPVGSLRIIVTSD